MYNIKHLYALINTNNILKNKIISFKRQIKNNYFLKILDFVRYLAHNET